MKLIKIGAVGMLVIMFAVSCKTKQENKIQNPAKREVWTVAHADEWYKTQPWLVGANFIPSTAINQLEMWQAETFDSATIDKELALAASLGMNTVRVFLHDLLYQNDKEGLYSRMEIFLRLSEKHGIKPLFVFFDSCWDPFPKLASKERQSLLPIIRVGCKVPGIMLCGIQPNTNAWKIMLRKPLHIFQLIRGYWAGMFGMNLII
jgi:hypothetical protein